MDNVHVILCADVDGMPDPTAAMGHRRSRTVS